MNILYFILCVSLMVLFFLNIRTASDLLCKTAGGFIFLYIYNILAASLALHQVGINLISSFICGSFCIPGFLLLLLSAIFL